MAAALSTTALRKVFQEGISLLASDVEALFESELESRVEEARRSSRREIAEALNQALRRLRCLESFAEVAATVVDSATRLCNSVAVFSVSGNTVKGECARGVTGGLERFPALRFALSDAAAFAGAVESRDPVITMGTPRELSPAVAEILPHGVDERVALIPIVVRERAAALLYAAGFEELAPLELLANAAALRLEVHGAPAQPRPAELISIGPAEAAGAPAPRIPESWSELPPEDQQIHLRAQRFARVQVAGMQVYAAEAVKAGRARRDLYKALEKDIDAARDVFRRSFVSACRTMVDYFHLELLRSLAHEDVALLGQSYPGPLV